MRRRNKYKVAQYFKRLWKGIRGEKRRASRISEFQHTGHTSLDVSTEEFRNSAKSVLKGDISMNRNEQVKKLLSELLDLLIPNQEDKKAPKEKPAAPAQEAQAEPEAKTDEAPSARKVFSAKEPPAGKSEIALFKAQWKAMGQKDQQRYSAGLIDSIGKELPQEETVPEKKSDKPIGAITKEQLFDAFKAYIAEKGRDAAVKVLAQFTVSKVSDLKEKEWGKFMDALNEKSADDNLF